MAQLVQSEEPLHPYFDGDYVRSLPGIARLIEVVRFENFYLLIGPRKLQEQTIDIF